MRARWEILNTRRVISGRGEPRDKAGKDRMGVGEGHRTSGDKECEEVG